MNKLIIIAIASLFIAACGGDNGPEPTCTEYMNDLYAYNCTMWDISVEPPEEWSRSEAIFWCRQVVDYVHDYCDNCVGKLNDWLACRPSFENDCVNCNDEQERMLACCD